MGAGRSRTGVHGGVAADAPRLSGRARRGTDEDRPARPHDRRPPVHRRRRPRGRGSDAKGCRRSRSRPTGCRWRSAARRGFAPELAPVMARVWTSGRSAGEAVLRTAGTARDRGTDARSTTRAAPHGCMTSSARARCASTRLFWPGWTYTAPWSARSERRLEPVELHDRRALLACCRAVSRRGPLHGRRSSESSGRSIPSTSPTSSTTWSATGSAMGSRCAFTAPRRHASSRSRLASSTAWWRVLLGMGRTSYDATDPRPRLGADRRA